MRNFVKLIRSCALLAFYDHPALAAVLATPATAAARDRDVRSVAGGTHE
jgi:hypothetical protein